MDSTLCRDCCRYVTPISDVCPDCGNIRLVQHAELTRLTIAHIDCDAFYASVEKRDRPDLHDRPLIVGHDGGRGVVTTCCYLARRYGVRSAMPMFKATQLCPEAVVLRPDMAKYKAVSEQIRPIFLAATEILEPVSLDEAYLDLGVCGDTGEAAVELARIARRVESEIGITVSIGLSFNKFLAKLASDMNKPRGFSVIGRSEAKTLLAPLPVRKINGVGAAMARRLEAAGIETIGQLHTMSEMQLVTGFGRFGRRLAQYAQGEDDRRVTPSRQAKSLSAETTFREDIASPEALNDIAGDLCQRVANGLARKEVAAHGVTLKLKTADFRVMTRSWRFPAPTQRAELLAEAVAILIRRTATGDRFRLIGVGAEGLAPAAEADPPSLFDLA